MPPEPEQADWTQGPAKWAAAVLLGAACVGGMAWSIVGRVPAPQWSAGPPARAVEAPEPTPSDEDRSPAPPASEAVARVNINTATLAELDMLPGIGPTLAERIIAHRERHGPFADIDGLDRVPGIGPRTMERLRPLIKVE